MGYIGAHGVAALLRYKHSGVDHSYLAKYVLQPFWMRCVHFFPLWMSYILWILTFRILYYLQFMIRSIEMVHKHFESFPKAIVNNLVSPQIKRL